MLLDNAYDCRFSLQTLQNCVSERKLRLEEITRETEQKRKLQEMEIQMQEIIDCNQSLLKQLKEKENQ